MKKVTAKPSNTPFKTLFEFCPSDENLMLAIRAIARNKKTITADDLHILDFSLQKLGYDRRKYGACLKQLADDGFLKKGVYVSSSREECHGRPVLEWHHVEGT